MSTEPIFTAADAGCYLDGHFGWHNIYRVIELAQTHGFALSEVDQGLVDAYGEQVESYTPDDTTDPYDECGIAEAVYEISNEATDYLGSITAAGLYWEWDMGELCLVESDEEES